MTPVNTENQNSNTTFSALNVHKDDAHTQNALIDYSRNNHHSMYTPDNNLSASSIPLTANRGVREENKDVLDNDDATQGNYIETNTSNCVVVVADN